MNNKIGIGLITFNSVERLKQSSVTIPVDKVDEFVIVNDGTPYSSNIYPKEAHVITHDKNLSVGCAKNTAIRYLMAKGCDHIFLQEDDILITNPNVFEEYIKHAYKTGLYFLTYGYHGPANVINGIPNPRKIVDYGNNIKIALNTHNVGAFSYQHKGIIKNIGLIDEYYKNAWEHISWNVRMIDKGLLPGYWWWPDVANSCEFLKEIGSSENQTVITRTEEWVVNFKRGATYFKHLHGNFPTEIPDIGETQVVENLKRIKKNYSRNIV